VGEYRAALLKEFEAYAPRLSLQKKFDIGGVAASSSPSPA